MRGQCAQQKILYCLCAPQVRGWARRRERTVLCGPCAWCLESRGIVEMIIINDMTINHVVVVFCDVVQHVLFRLVLCFLSHIDLRLASRLLQVRETSIQHAKIVQSCTLIQSSVSIFYPAVSVVSSDEPYRHVLYLRIFSVNWWLVLVKIWLQNALFEDI